MLLFTYLRLAASFSNYDKRLKCVQARLQSLSVLIYSNQLTENIQSLLYSGLLEELVEVLEMPDSRLMEIKASALKSLTSIIHLDRNPNFPKVRMQSVLKLPSSQNVAQSVPLNTKLILMNHFLAEHYH